jgi:sulfate transport system substrate-binding protein
MLLGSLAVLGASCRKTPEGGTAGSVTLMNVSYDPTRELYEEFNRAFAADWKAKSGQTVSITQSHGASGKQSQSVVNGLAADVVTLGISYDIDTIAKAGLIAPNWQERLPDNSTPYTSTIVFLVRKGNPKNVKDWPDLIRPDVQSILPNPKTSSGGRWAYVAAWGYALHQNNNSDAADRDYVTKLFKNVPVLATGARDATTTFERGSGDVLIAWENEALLAVNKLGADKFEMVVPSMSIVAEPPVSVVDKNVAHKGTQAVAEAYLKYLYSKEGQAIVARNYYRPRNTEGVDPADLKRFADLKLFTFESAFGTWQKVQDAHFKDGGILDQILRANKS